jgi:hypothetical protein
MSTSTVNPKGEPESYLGDLDKISVGASYYAGDEGTHTEKLIKEYLEQQSRTPAHHRVFFELDDRWIDYQRQYGLRYSFHNYTNTDIVVVDRLGLPVTITPERRKPETAGVFVIRKEMYFDNAKVSHQAYRNVQSLGRLHGAELTRLMPELGREVIGHRFGRCLCLEYSITEAEITAGDGRLYHLPTDMVVSFLSAGETIRHPSSPEYSQNYAPFIPNFPDGTLDVRVAYRYVSADVKALPKYVRVGSNVFMLQPERREPAKLVTMPIGKDKTLTDVEMSEYIELIYPAHLDATREGVRGYRCQRVTLAEAKDQLDVYDTLEDAKNPIQVTEREKKQHKDELASQAAKHAEQLRGLQEKLVEKEDDNRRHKRTIDDLREARDLEIERMREENERASHKRKLGTENIKLITGIATAAVTLAGLYLKYKSGKSTS